jgi:peroxiredoxin (alkyl hydroperoxide reductase subunit C)
MSTEAVPGGIPRIGDPAPDFKAITTHGEIQFSEWAKDSWVVLFSHPADFTPVCTTELTELQKRSKDFSERGCKLIGLSIDSIHSHLAWRENIREKLGVEIGYPLIADLSMDVASKYGMIHPGASSTATVRAVFFIDPKRTIRALVYYPMANGRNVDELLRVVESLQTSDKNACATPVNWRKGDKVIVPPPKTVEDVARRREMSGNKEDYTDFYLTRKTLPA